uniref:Uncharacterized protein n=1 Tax=Compsopogon caeruleus TaxID=31354 RepID=A0A7S1TER6_9RHOD
MAEERLFDFRDGHMNVKYEGDQGWCDRGFPCCEPAEVWVALPTDGSNPEDVRRFNEEHTRTFQVWNESALRKRGSDRERDRLRGNRCMGEVRRTGSGVGDPTNSTDGSPSKGRRRQTRSSLSDLGELGVPADESRRASISIPGEALYSGRWDGILPDRESIISRTGSTTSMSHTPMPNESRRLSSSDRNIVIKLRHTSSSGSLSSSASSRLSHDIVRSSARQLQNSLGASAARGTGSTQNESRTAGDMPVDAVGIVAGVPSSSMGSAKPNKILIANSHPTKTRYPSQPSSQNSAVGTNSPRFSILSIMRRFRSTNSRRT